MGLLLVESATLFAAAVTTVFLWGSPHLLDWIDAARFLGQAAALSLCCILAIKVMADLIPYYSLRHVVRPGLTGWAQVRYGYSVSFEQVTEKMRYDLFYIKHMSFWLDLRILVDTLKIALFGRGAR